MRLRQVIGTGLLSNPNQLFWKPGTDLAAATVREDVAALLPLVLLLFEFLQQIERSAVD